MLLNLPNGKREHIVKDAKASIVTDSAASNKINSVIPSTDVIVEEPANRGSGSYCTVVFDNYTGYAINVYIVDVDTIYKGWIEPWGKGEISYPGGWTSWYCESAGGGCFWTNGGDCFSDWYVNLRY